jgi:hypothetical protein
MRGSIRLATALGALLLAFLARTQFFVLALALPLSLLGHELTLTAVAAEGDTWWLRLRSRLKRALALHRVLFSFYAAACVAAVGLAATGSLGTVVGNYAVPFSGDLLPAGIWHSAAVHLDYVVIGGGILPFVLTASWALTTAVRPEGRGAHAFAWLLLMLVPLLTLEVASFDLRFTPNALRARQDLSLWRFWEVLPVDRPEDAITLGEGGTPGRPCCRCKLRLARRARFVRWSPDHLLGFARVSLPPGRRGGGGDGSTL